MKQITLNIDDDAFQAIKTQMGVRIMTGSAYGTLDEFIILIVKSVDKGLETIDVVKKKPGDKRTKI